MVTADGATLMNHGDMEREHLPLLWAQSLVAVHCLCVGGDLVLKLFEAGLYETQLLMAMLTIRFRNVSIIKPFTSRNTNSERYLVCRSLESRGLVRNDNLVVSPVWLQDTRKIIDRLLAYQNKELTGVLREFDGLHRSSS